MPTSSTFDPPMTQDGADDPHLLKAVTVRAMFLVEIEAMVASGHRLSDDEITGLVESVVDDLDRLPVEPSVATRRVDNDVRFTVGVTVDEVEEFDALTLSVGIIKAAFYTAAIGTAELVPHDLRCRVMPLQPA